jgi:hypothetical protein
MINPGRLRGFGVDIDQNSGSASQLDDKRPEGLPGHFAFQ